MKCLLAAVPVDVDAALSLADRGERATICRHLAWQCHRRVRSDNRLEGKRLELLGELVSASAPVAVLINPKGEYAEQQAKDLQAGAPRIGRRILILNASSERDIDNAFRALIAGQAAGLLVAGRICRRSPGYLMLPRREERDRNPKPAAEPAKT